MLIQGGFMSENKWILENGLLEDRKRKKDDILDFFFLILISLLVPLATIGKIVPEDGSREPIENYIDGYAFGKYYQYVNREPDTWVAIVLFSLIGVLLILYYIQRYRHTGRKPSRIFLTITIIYLLLRVFGTFLFPYGPLDFHYISPLGNDTPYTISYSGFTLSARFKQLFSEVISVFYVFELFTFLPTYSRHSFFWFRILVSLGFLIPTFLLLYSWIKEGNLWIGNLKSLIHGGKFNNISSLTTHKNVFGYFLLIGCLTFLTIYFKKHHFVFAILALFYCGCTLVILSKTTFLIGIFAVLSSLIIYPILFFRKRKANSILSLSLLLLFIIAGVLLVHRFGFQKLIDKVFDPGSTFSMRINHIKVALSMFRNQSWFYLVFGYGRLPFTSIYLPYQHIIPYEALWTSHNCYIEALMHTGIIGLVYLLLLDFYFLKKTHHLCRKNKQAAIYFITFLFLSIYGALEPRMMFLNTGFEILPAYFIVFYPAMVEEGNSSLQQVV